MYCTFKTPSRPSLRTHPASGPHGLGAFCLLAIVNLARTPFTADERYRCCYVLSTIDMSKITYMEQVLTYSAQRKGGNCQRGTGRCSAAQTESLSPCKIGLHNLLILKQSDFAAMEKVRENALISLFWASFYCGKEAKTLSENTFSSGFLC